MSLPSSETGRRRYEFGVALGQGGFGSVYAAQLVGEGGFKKPVAIKLLRPELADDTRLTSRLRDEARILSMLNHRAVVTVHDLVRLDGRWALVMERVDGVDLGSLDAQMPLRPALEVVAEVASALDLAHNAPGPDGKPLRLLHRDIKPSNILLTATGAVKILDFGIARAEFGEREAVTRSVAYGSPEYMAPERLEWENGPEGDLYGLGVVLFEMVSGQRFGMSSGHPDRHARKVAEAQGLLRALVDAEAVVDLVGELLAYEPAARPTARALERRCVSLVESVGGIRLRDWAEEEIPRLAARRTVPKGGALSGAVLIEGDSQESETRTSSEPESYTLELPKPAPAGSSLARKSLLVLSFGFSAALAFAVGALLFWAWLHRPPAVSPPTAPSAPAVVTPAVPASEPKAPVVIPEVVQEVRPSSRSGTRAASTSSPASTATSTLSSASPTGAVLVSGDAERVELSSGGRSYTALGAIPPGTYDILVTFAGRDPIASGGITVPEGGSVTLFCSAALKRCAVR